MTTVVSSKTQLEFQLPPGGVQHYHGNMERYHSNLPPTNRQTGRDQRPFVVQKQNQLAFNVDMSTTADNLTRRYRKPSAIVVEKLNATPAKRKESDAASIGKISLLSHERLTQALFLAKRDNMKRRRNDQVFTVADVSTVDSGQTEDNIEETKLKVVKERNIERNTRKSMKEETQKEELSPQRMKIRQQDLKVSPGVVLKVAEDVGVAEGLPGDRHARQVWKLRKEVQRYVKELEGHLRQGPVPSPSKRKRRGSVEKISDTEDDPRAEVRRHEQLSRAARIVYTLQHQIAEVQQELSRPTSEKGKQGRKTQVLKKLGAAHRAAVKVLQVFIQQLPDQYSGGGGLPAVYQDLGRVIKQLSQLSAEVEVGSGSDKSAENLLQLLERALPKPPVDLPKEVHKRAPGGQMKVKRRAGQHIWKEAVKSGPKPPAVHRLEDDVTELLHQETSEGDPEREDILRAGIAALRQTSAKRPKRTQRLGRSPKRRGILASPRSKKTPRRAPGSPVGEHTLASWAKVKPPLPYMGKENRSPHWSPPPQHGRMGSGARRSLEYRDVYRYPEDLVNRFHGPFPSRQSSVPQDARRNLDFKDTYGSHADVERRRVESPSRDLRSSPGGRRNVDLRHVYENLRREKAWEEVPQGSLSHPKTDSGVGTGLDKKDVYGGIPGATGQGGWQHGGLHGEISEAGERRREARDVYGGITDVMDRRGEPRSPYGGIPVTEGRRGELKGVYGGIAAAGGRMQENRGLYGGMPEAGGRRQEHRTDRQYFDQRIGESEEFPERNQGVSSEDVRRSQDVLKNVLLEEVLEDTAAELQRLEGQRSGHREVMALQDMSTLNNILERLQLAEEEEEVMRSRWIRAEYANELDHIWARYRKDTWSPKPPSHPRPAEGRPRSADEGRLYLSDPVSFQQGPRTQDDLELRPSHHTGVKHPTSAHDAPPVLLFTPAGQMQDIRDYRRRFDQHRRRTNHETAGAFNPWKLVDQLADELMDDVMDTVVMEMAAACEDCVEQVYRSEFT